MEWSSISWVVESRTIRLFLSEPWVKYPTTQWLDNVVYLLKGRLKHDTFGSTTGRPEIGRNTLISVLWNFSKKPEAREIFSLKIRFQVKFIKNIHSIRTGVEKYLGLIAGRKFTGRTEIGPMDRKARGGSLHEFRTWCQLSSKLSVYRSLRCRRSWKQSMQPDT